MDIFTIVKANIKSHKGQFIGLALLVIFCVSSIIAFYNVMESSNKSISDEYDYINVPNDNILIERSKLTDEMLLKLGELDEVDNYVVTPVLDCHAVAPYGWDYNDSSRVYQSLIFLQTKPNSSSGMRYPQINEDITERISDDYVINQGETYLANGIASQLKVKVGDKIEITCENIKRVFVIKGIIEDQFSSTTIGYKNILVSEEDYNSFYNEVTATYDGLGFESDYNSYIVSVYKKDSSMPTNEFRRAVNKTTGIYDFASSVTEREEFLGYNALVPKTFSLILIIVALILYTVLIIIVGNTISSAVRDNYKTLGILKANGFSAGKLKLVYIFQYLTIEAAGIIIGIILGYSLCGLILNAFAKISGYICKPHIDWLITGLIILGFLIFSLIVIVISTFKISSVSPYKAISDTKDDVSFNNNSVNPITHKCLSLSLALRQITSSKLSYLGLITSALILMVLLVFNQASEKSMSSKSTVLSMSPMGEVYIHHFEHLTSEEQDEVMEYINSKVTLQDYYESTTYYTSGEFGNILTSLYKDIENIPCLTKGRAPVYDNEAVIGTGIASSYGKEIGDTIELTYNGKAYEYLITGIISSTQDIGNVAALGLEAARKIGFDDRLDYETLTLVIKNPDNPNEWYPRSNAEALANDLNEKFDDLNCVASDTSVFGSQIQQIINLIKYVIYVVTAAVVFIIINMSCSKFFANEIKQCGTMKALGFTSNLIRIQFALRFAIVFTIGSLIGGILSGLILEPVFGILFGFFGAARVNVNFYPSLYLIPLVFIMVISFICAYFSSKKVRKLDINVLITE